MIDFSWLLYIGHSILGFTEKEVGHFTFSKLMKLYGHYKNHYDFMLKKVSYNDLEEAVIQNEEWIPE